MHFFNFLLCQRAKPDRVDRIQDLAFDPVTKYILDLIQTWFLDRVRTWVSDRIRWAWPHQQDQIQEYIFDPIRIIIRVGSLLNFQIGLETTFVIGSWYSWIFRLNQNRTLFSDLFRGNILNWIQPCFSGRI